MSMGNEPGQKNSDRCSLAASHNISQKANHLKGVLSGILLNLSREICALCSLFVSEEFYIPVNAWVMGNMGILRIYTYT